MGRQIASLIRSRLAPAAAATAATTALAKAGTALGHAAPAAQAASSQAANCWDTYDTNTKAAMHVSEFGGGTLKVLGCNGLYSAFVQTNQPGAQAQLDSGGNQTCKVHQWTGSGYACRTVYEPAPNGAKVGLIGSGGLQDAVIWGDGQGHYYDFGG